MTDSPSDRDDTAGPTKAPKSAAERQRRYRARQTEGVAVYRIEAVPSVRKMLVKIGFLTKEEAQDRRQVAAALEGFIDCLARGTLDLEKLLAAIKNRDDCQKRGVFRPGPIVVTGTSTNSW